jgi:hypothetical protein
MAQKLYVKGILRIKTLKNFSVYFKKKTGMRCLHPTSRILLIISSWTHSVITAFPTFPLKVTHVKDYIANKWITKKHNYFEKQTAITI